MHRTILRLTVPLAFAAALAATACLPASAATAGPAVRPSAASVSGWARMAYGDPRDDVQVSVDARGLFRPRDAAPAPDRTTALRSWGTFRIQHYSPAKDGRPASFNWGDFAVDCLRIDGTEVSVTGRLVDAGPAWKEFLDRGPLPARMGLSLHLPSPGDADAARIGLIPPAPEGSPDIPKCRTALADAGLSAGGYAVTVGGNVAATPAEGRAATR
ncbi:hypothetical protein ACGFY6_09235 [Streptomyces sp. NPDC048387]|uniref:hypothetical protein n=1 Tax=Streptomyces sp. NPDC048387 TaxID=3365542 RepID=UPI003716A33F